MGILSIPLNIFNIIIMSRQRNLSPYTYLTVLAVCDLLTGVLFVYNGLLRSPSLLRIHRNIRLLGYHTQLPAYFLRSWLSTSASYIVNALGVDRLIVVAFPMQRTRWCTPKIARIVSCILCLSGFIPNFHLLLRYNMIWIPDPQTGLFMPLWALSSVGRDPLVKDVTSYGKFILRQVIPLFLMIFTSSWTMKCIIRSMRFRQRSASATKKQNVPCLGLTLVVIAVFMVTNFPLALYALDQSINGIRPPPTSLTTAVFFALLEILPWCNAFANFFIYTLMNDQFKRDFIALLTCARRQENSEKQTQLSDLSCTF